MTTPKMYTSTSFVNFMVRQYSSKPMHLITDQLHGGFDELNRLGKIVLLFCMRAFLRTTND
ncbi:hypothetical protein Sjap_001322 [Stephania japonica]|uniref:Uncharacterized protein n=1 Tax=Stephania japonica TaxID=461633 RepID=A0AAP0KM14_9MAGN